MTRVFADSFYFFALANPLDAAHRKALAYSRAQNVPLVLTTWVLTEVADGLGHSVQRGLFQRILIELHAGRGHVIVPTTDALWNKGVELYDARSDKRWSLTDCISFVVMTDEGITDALTGDQHFIQAGFHALLR
ncbi:MAG TPA: hypothetical protein VIK18_05325 [Pirellulales bacterium]